MKITLIARAAAAATLMTCVLWQPAKADDTVTTQAQAASTNSSDIQDWSRWQIRLRALGVVTDTSSATATVQGVPALSTPNSGLSVGNSVVPELDITYYFTRNISAELILGVSQNHITGNGALTGLDVGSTWLLPPTLTVQYHFTDFGRFQPYLGVGINYTFFFGQQPAGAYTPGGLAITNLNIHNTAGFAAQAGFDYMIDKHWGINFDVKKLILRPNYDAWVNNSIYVSGTAALDPWLFGAGITYRF
ncbi:outer membrane protein [Enhydrobacter aerosaccus]|uniref:Outer membrane protein n=2 Tax=Enhydrobacter aerosaccus TaxID=225324 RepID=A0A1T4MTN4_9HYPH|nr:OmpW family outer membrane protein [Enhydrobacter aerosaccus]SJZ70216.1 outer membrane protein [Enhydrobacter aerosaccus]